MQVLTTATHEVRVDRQWRHLGALVSRLGNRQHSLITAVSPNLVVSDHYFKSQISFHHNISNTFSFGSNLKHNISNLHHDTTLIHAALTTTIGLRFDGSSTAYQRSLSAQ